MRVIKYSIKENSWLAMLATKKLGSKTVAMVVGSTIHLWGISKEAFRNDRRWLRHEQAHLKQFAENGTILFLIKYILESIRSGYYDNKYEVEARKAEEEILGI